MPINRRKKAAVQLKQPRPEKQTEVPVVPSDLLRAAPRPVRLTFAGWAAACVVTTLLVGSVVTAVWFPRTIEREQGRRNQFEREAVNSEGEILRLGQRHGKEERRDSPIVTPPPETNTRDAPRFLAGTGDD